MKFRQLIDPITSTYSYLLWDPETLEAVIIDPVKEHTERDISLIKELGLKLSFSLETHIHADHVTGAGLLRDALGCRIAMHKNSQAECADLLIGQNDQIEFGRYALQVLHTPGHTNTDICFLTEGKIFTGDTLLIRGSGRTDFQSGDAGKAYDSIMQKIFSLPDETVIYPGHDYRGLTQTTVGEEKCFNPRLKHNSRDEYIRIMQEMDLPKPKKIDFAVPGNMRCGNS